MPLQSGKTPTSQELRVPPDMPDPLLGEKKQEEEEQEEALDLATLRSPRRFLSRTALFDALLDFSPLLAAIYFIIFGALVYKQHNQLVSDRTSSALLEASKYGPTLFPIIFAAIVAKALRSVAAFKLEHGANVLTLGSLLGSRSVSGVLMTPLSLRAIDIITPLLIVLWAFSPLGGQASLRVISTAPSSIFSTGEVVYFNSSSPFINEGPKSASAVILSQINGLFTSYLVSPANSKASGQDQFGNIKVPMLEYLSAPSNDSGWVDLSGDDLVYSAIAGLPTLGIPDAGSTTFTIETAYMHAHCSLNHSSPAAPYKNYTTNTTGGYYMEYYNGENYLMKWYPLSSFIQDNDTYWVEFQSIGGDGWCTWDYLTTAMCNLSTSYVEVKISCEGTNCASQAIRSSRRKHPPSNLVFVNGLANEDDMLAMYFFPDFINSTYTEALCDASCCSASPLEAYLLDPGSPYSLLGEAAAIWPIGETLFSQRFSQLLNTYWLASVGSSYLLGNFIVPNASTEYTYKVSNASSATNRAITVIHCRDGWLAVLFLSSLVMLLVGMAGGILNACRKGPDIFDPVGALLRQRPSVGIAQGSSMEDGKDAVRRLRRMKVRLGDVRPEEDFGYVAIAPIVDSTPVKKLNDRRQYG